MRPRCFLCVCVCVCVSPLSFLGNGWVKVPLSRRLSVNIYRFICNIHVSDIMYILVYNIYKAYVSSG
jgi:hypothetical protein